LAALFSTFFTRLLGARRRILAAGLSAAGILFYTILTGVGASVVRRCDGRIVVVCPPDRAPEGWVEQPLR